MTTYEQIKKANETLKTTDVKGKPYIEVNQRIKAFRMVYPEGFILTELVNDNGGICTFTARVGYYTEDGREIILGTGTAFEREDASFINKTSYIENCETSAVGRALGMAGFGIDTSVASAEEVQNAINNQDAPKTEYASAEQLARIRELIEEDKIPALIKFCKVERLEDITAKQAAAIIRKKEGK